MQVVRYSKECRWITDCKDCGCVFIYRGDEVEKSEIKVENTFSEDGEPVKQTICTVMCPDCHQPVRIPLKACNRTGAVVCGTDEEWGYYSEGC